MKLLLIFIFCFYSVGISAQVVITDIHNEKIPREVRENLKNLPVEQIENFKQSGKIKTEINNNVSKVKYDLKIQDSTLVGTITSNNVSTKVNAKLIWYCDHDPLHSATSPKQIKEYTDKYGCKNWSPQ
jgi:hypothetical protein